MRDPEEVRDTAQTAVREDPTITDPTKILVSVEKKGPLFRKKQVVILEGTVKSEIETKKAVEVVQRKLPDIEIENRLKTE